MVNYQWSQANPRRVGLEIYHLQDPKDKNAVTCNFCGKVIKGGISRETLSNWKIKNVKDCKKCSKEVKDEVSNYMNERKSLQNDFPSLLDFDFEGDMIE